MKKILGMGNALIDVLVRIDSDSELESLGLPKGSMQLIDTSRFDDLYQQVQRFSYHKATGGSAANTILALANLGVPTGFIGRTSDDANGNFFAVNANAHHIQFHRVSAVGHSGTALTFISPDGQRTFGTHLGVAAGLQAEDLSEDMFRGYDLLHIEGYLTQDHSLIERAFQLAHAAGLRISLDLSSFNIVAADRDFFHTLVCQSEIVFSNEEEAEAFTGMAAEDALEEFASLAHTVVVKIGQRGALVASGDERVSVPAHSVPVVDTTGAGDYFAAGFLYGQASGKSLQQSAEIGTLLASKVLQVVGTTLTDDTWQNIGKYIS